MAVLPWGFFFAVDIATDGLNRPSKMAQIIMALTLVAITSLTLLLGGVPAYLHLPAYALVSISGLLGAAKRWRSHGRSPSAVGIWSAVLLVLVILVRALLSPDPFLARPDLYGVLSAFVLYALVSLFLTPSKLRLQLAIGILVIASVSFVIGGIQFFKGGNFMPFSFLPRGEYGSRASGFFGCPNHLAGFLEIAMFVGLSLAFWSRYGLLGRIASGYVAAMCAIGILLTGSRGGYVSALAGLIAFAVLSLYLAGRWVRREVWYAALVVVVLGGIGGAIFLRSAVGKSDLLQYRVESVNIDSGIRLKLAKAAWRQFQVNPVFGTGSRTYAIYGRTFREHGINADPLYAHNDYAQLLGEYGILGGLACALFLGAHMRLGWQSMAKVAAEQRATGRHRESKKKSTSGSRSRSAWRAVADDESRRLEEHKPSFKGSHSLALTLAAFCTVIAYLVHSTVDFNLHIPANACLMAVIFGILSSPGVSASGAGESVEWPLSPTAFNVVSKLPALAGLALLVMAVPKWPGEYYGERARRLLSDWRMLEDVEIPKKAESFARKAIGYDPKNPELQFYLAESQILLATFAQSAEESDRFNEAAVAAYRAALAISPMEVRYSLLLGGALDSLGRYDEAAKAYEHARQLDPNSGTVYSCLGAHLQKQQKLEEAEAAFDKALAITGTFVEGRRLQEVQKEIAAKKSAPASTETPK